LWLIFDGFHSSIRSCFQILPYGDRSFSGVGSLVVYRILSYPTGTYGVQTKHSHRHFSTNERSLIWICDAKESLLDDDDDYQILLWRLLHQQSSDYSFVFLFYIK
jgi:hypothetical protein